MLRAKGRVPAEKWYRPISRHQQPENLQQDFQGNAVAPARVGLLQRRGRWRGPGFGLGRTGPWGRQPLLGGGAVATEPLLAWRPRVELQPSLRVRSAPLMLPGR